MTTPGERVVSLVARTGVLGSSAKQLLARELTEKRIDPKSVSALRNRLGLPTIDAGALSRAYEQVADGMGEDVARGIVLGACASASAPDPELVWTAPRTPAAARRTAQVALELVAHAHKSVVVVGYSLTKAAAPFIDALASARRRGVSCVIVADRMDEKLSTLSAHWPKEIGLPPLWTRPGDPSDRQSALHAKFIVVDASRLLVTSANLTYHGFHGNIEMGVLVSGSVAAEAEQLIREWSKAGLIHRVGRSS